MVFFHNPDKPYGFLSNWYLSQMCVDNTHYTSMEQYMMHQEALVFDDSETAEKILASNNVAEIKALGRSVKNYNDIIWTGLRQIIVYKGLLCKFEQNKDLKEQLLATGTDMLIECAVKDTVWAIGLSLKDERRKDPSLWRGTNLLGFALMEVRKTLSR